jgi:hypothetical protein
MTRETIARHLKPTLVTDGGAGLDDELGAVAEA